MASTGTKAPITSATASIATRRALNALKKAAEVYPCFCTRAELHTASAPHASDGTPIYAGTCRGLSPAEVAERSGGDPRRNGLPCPRRTTRPGPSRLSTAFMGPQREVLARECGDFLVQRSDGVFAYQLAVVVGRRRNGRDRGRARHDLLSSTARQIYLQRLLGFEQPHTPMFRC